MFIDLIGKLAISGGDGCNGPSIGAIIQAATHSQPGASIFLFTDALPSDSERISELEVLLRDKSLTVNSFLTGDCWRGQKRAARRIQRRRAVNNPYGYLAMKSRGQVFSVDTAALSQLYPIVSSSFQPSSLTIFHYANKTGFTGTINVFVDSTIAELVVRISGDSLNSVGLSTPLGEHIIHEAII